MNIISIVYKKELIDIFRDKKTLVAAILIPFLIYPLIFGFMGKGIKDTTDFIEEEGGVKIALIDDDNSEIGNILKSRSNIDIKDSDNIADDVQSGKILLGIEIPQGFQEKIANEEETNITITYDNTSQKSSMALSFIKELLDEYSKGIVAHRLEARDMDATILTPIDTITKSPDRDDTGFGKLMLSLILPMMLVIFAASGPIASAVDLGAGEKERGTLEPLLTTQASRMSLLWGKFLAITTMGVMTSIAFIGGLAVSMQMSPEAFGYEVNEATLALEPAAFVIIALITILLTMVFGALALAISIYARSFKEAQTYLTPLNIIGILGATSYFIEPKNMPSAFLHIPIINVVVIIKELTLGIFNTNHLLVVFVWMIIYIILSISFARYMFSKEEVIFRT